MRILLVIVFVYVICWILVMIIDLVDMVFGGWVFFYEVYLMYLICGFVSCCINFLVYGIMNKVFCNEYVKLFGLWNCNKNFSNFCKFCVVL